MDVGRPPPRRGRSGGWIAVVKIATVKQEATIIQHPIRVRVGTNILPDKLHNRQRHSSFLHLLRFNPLSHPERVNRMDDPDSREPRDGIDSRFRMNGSGAVLEWLKRRHWKCRKRRPRFEGSNPSRSVIHMCSILHRLARGGITGHPVAVYVELVHSLQLSAATCCAAFCATCEPDSEPRIARSKWSSVVWA